MNSLFMKSFNSDISDIIVLTERFKFSRRRYKNERAIVYVKNNITSDTVGTN